MYVTGLINLNPKFIYCFVLYVFVHNIYIYTLGKVDKSTKPDISFLKNVMQVVCQRPN